MLIISSRQAPTSYSVAVRHGSAAACMPCYVPLNYAKTNCISLAQAACTLQTRIWLQLQSHTENARKGTGCLIYHTLKSIETLKSWLADAIMKGHRHVLCRLGKLLVADMLAVRVFSKALAKTPLLDY